MRRSDLKKLHLPYFTPSKLNLMKHENVLHNLQNLSILLKPTFVGVIKIYFSTPINNK